MNFKIFADYLSRLEKTASRNKITEILADLLKKSSSEEVDKVCYLSLGQLAPSYVGMEFNLAEKLMIRAVSKAFNSPEEKVKEEYKRVGDLGEVGRKFKVKSQEKKMSVSDVYQKLYEIAMENGNGSVERKISKMANLLNEVDALSCKYIIRVPLGKLRLGFSELTVLDALSWMIAGDKSRRKEIEEVYNVRTDIGQIARLIKNKGLHGLKGIGIQIGVPVMPALCQRLPNAEEIIKKMKKVAVEPKYDGTRLSVHFSKNKLIRMFTRNLENVTHMFPDLAEAVNKEIEAKEVILDGEAIGFNPETGKFLPFQETIKRKRKYEIGNKAKEIPLKYFVFDILFKNGRDLINLPLNQRRKILEETILKDSKIFKISPQIVTEKSQEIKKFHRIQIKKGLEGVVVKKWEAFYDPGRRGYTWVKFKQEKGKKGGGLSDTLDCVIMGYYQGKGKRASFGIGAFLVGIKESISSEKILTISKIGTGLSDEQWREMRKRIEKAFVSKKPKSYLVDKNLTPDVWCSPSIVVEIEADNITKSPIHTATLALRFPRLIRFRDDKSVEQATTLKEALKIFRLQG
jgi:DNA ligase 1